MPNLIGPPSSQATIPHDTSGLSNRNARMCATRIIGTVLTLLIMLALKHHYSQASADQLAWILAPTAKLVAWLTPAHPVYESGVGYVDFAQGIIVAPACAGVNFLIMVFGLSAFCGLLKINRLARLWIWLAASFACAYGYTVLTNAVRIGLSMVLYQADIYGPWLTAERVHRIAGITLYLGALWVYFAGLRAVLDLYGRAKHHQADTSEANSLPGWLPLIWYVIGAIGVPFINLLFQRRTPGFNEHCLTVLIMILCLACSVKCLGWLIRQRARAMPSNRLPKHDGSPDN